ncbi:MAG: 16S rRNA (cytidine(1402)-2'-O)-methyltransferase [Chloroflexi bacterium]|nr:16S rRNA (cytidine(1402)-2'-O)-methyltransferase [Chloroflexota bacterium]
MGDLYLIATPIGNLEDITLRALRLLGEVPLIAAEDTRTIRKLLTRHGIAAPKLLSYTERNRKARTPALLAALEEGDIALVSEAGTPAISDPGVHLTQAALAAGHRVVPIPGPSAVIAALAASGLSTRRFHYLGFLPRQPGQRRRLLREVATIPDTLVAFESPHRLRQALTDLIEAFGDRQIAVCRELTKLHEELFRGTATEALAHFARPRGEFTLVIEGAGDTKPKPESSLDIDVQLRELKRRGVRARDAVRRVSVSTGLPHRQVYSRWLALADEDKPSVS